MARDFSPRGHIERRDKQDLSLFSGVTSRESKFKVDTAPGQHGMRGGKLSQYGKQFRAKQLAKHMYGILERQFRNYFKKASKSSGATGDNLLRALETRLDNVVYRLGFARTRKEARQLVSHRSIVVVREGRTKTVNIPSFAVLVNDEILVKERSKQQGRIKEALELSKQRVQPEWLEVKADELKGTMKRLPERNEMPQEIDELLIIELYSR